MEPWRVHFRGQLLGGSCGQPTDERSLATMPLTPPWLLQCCQSSETHHVHNLIKHHCSGEVLRQSPKPRCVLRTLQKRGRSSCLKVPCSHPQILRESVVVQIEPRSFSLKEVVGQTLRPDDSSPNCTSGSARRRPRVSGLDGTKRLRLGLPTHGFSTPRALAAGRIPGSSASSDADCLVFARRRSCHSGRSIVGGGEGVGAKMDLFAGDSDLKCSKPASLRPATLSHKHGPTNTNLRTAPKQRRHRAVPCPGSTRVYLPRSVGPTPLSSAPHDSWPCPEENPVAFEGHRCHRHLAPSLFFLFSWTDVGNPVVRDLKLVTWLRMTERTR